MRTLTSKFGTYRLGQYEKKTGKGIMDIMNIGNFELSKIATLIKLGSPEIPMDNDEMAYDKLDKYLTENEENSVITAYFDLLDDLNKDLKIFVGVDMTAMKKEMQDSMKEMTDKIKNKSLTGNKEPVEKEEEAVKEDCVIEIE